jgi:hypothetical protein
MAHEGGDNEGNGNEGKDDEGDESPDSKGDEGNKGGGNNKDNEDHEGDNNRHKQTGTSKGTEGKAGVHICTTPAATAPAPAMRQTVNDEMNDKGDK